MKFPEYIDYYLGKRIKTKYAYHPYKLTFDYLQLNALEAIKLYWVFSKADRDGSGIIDSFEWLMYLDVERTEFNEKVRPPPNHSHHANLPSLKHTPHQCPHTDLRHRRLRREWRDGLQGVCNVLLELRERDPYRLDQSGVLPLQQRWSAVEEG